MFPKPHRIINTMTNHEIKFDQNSYELTERPSLETDLLIVVIFWLLPSLRM
jgi:hypothetical protein